MVCMTSLHHCRSYATWAAYLDEIVFLRDPDLFINKIMVEVGARTPPKNGKKQPPALNKPAFVAETVSTRYVAIYHNSSLDRLTSSYPYPRIHNAYMVASAWKLVLDSLGELRIDGLGNRSAATDLRNDSDLRSRYLVLYDMVGKLVEIGQSKFSVLATTTRKSPSTKFSFFLSGLRRERTTSTLRSILQA